MPANGERRTTANGQESRPLLRTVDSALLARLRILRHSPPSASPQPDFPTLLQSAECLGLTHIQLRTYRIAHAAIFIKPVRFVVSWPDLRFVEGLLGVPWLCGVSYLRECHTYQYVMVPYMYTHHCFTSGSFMFSLIFVFSVFMWWQVYSLKKKGFGSFNCRCDSQGEWSEAFYNKISAERLSRHSAISSRGKISLQPIFVS